MKNLYYFSPKKLKFVEIRGFYRKFIFLIFFTSFILSFLFLGSYYVFNEFINPTNDIKHLKNQNKILSKKLRAYSQKFTQINKRIDSLMFASNDLRLSANLPSLKKSDLNFGTGGGSLSDHIDFITNKSISNSIHNLDRLIDKIDSKLEFEKYNFEKIKIGLKNNETLFQSIPAIKPCEGFLGDNFGMRFHPILHVRRMHMGIDIICDVGTPFFAPGGGVVEFAGIKGGYGKTLVINHGFGYKTLYAHLNTISVKVGQKVTRGTFLGQTGNTGLLTTGPHLHYEVHHNGVALNPLNFIYDDVNIFEKKSYAIIN